jgi:Tfp pilus assembly protein PilF
MYYHQKKYELAFNYYETAQRLMPNNPVVLANIACCQMDMGKTEEALVTFKKAKDALNIEKNMNPSNKIYLNNKMKDFSQAMENKDPKFQRQFEEIKKMIKI